MKPLKVYSQTGEEGVLEHLFAVLGTGSQYLVDLGAGDGRTLSNTRLFLDRGWRGARFDLVDVPAEGVRGVPGGLTAENVAGELAAAGVPLNFDFLSLDLDGNDWWILREVLRAGYRPRVLCCEINANFPPYPARTIVYQPRHRFDETDYYGATLGAFCALTAAYGYRLQHVQQSLNAFFVAAGEPEVAGCTCHCDVGRHWPADPRRRPWHMVDAGATP